MVLASLAAPSTHTPYWRLSMVVRATPLQACQSRYFVCLGTFPLFPFSLHSVILFGHPREIYCFGVLANPRFRRSERSAFGIISRCKRSCLGSSRFPLVKPVQRVKIIHSIGRKAKPSRREQATQRETGGRGVAADTDTTTNPRGQTHTYRSGVGLHTYIHTYVGSCGCCGAKRWLAKRVLVGLALDCPHIHT